MAEAALMVEFLQFRFRSGFGRLAARVLAQLRHEFGIGFLFAQDGGDVVDIGRRRGDRLTAR